MAVSASLPRLVCLLVCVFACLRFGVGLLACVRGWRAAGATVMGRDDRCPAPYGVACGVRLLRAGGLVRWTVVVWLGGVCLLVRAIPSPGGDGACPGCVGVCASWCWRGFACGRVVAVRGVKLSLLGWGRGVLLAVVGFWWWVRVVLAARGGGAPSFGCEAWCWGRGAFSLVVGFWW